jgi:cobalt-zinc-cadmium efflux system outer membrane protein
MEGPPLIRNAVLRDAVYSFLLLPTLGWAESPQLNADINTRYTLSEILELGEQRNPSLATFLANIEVAQGDARTARAYPNPNVLVQGGRGEPRGPDVGVLPAGAEYQATVIQPLEWPLKRQSRIQAATARVDVAQLDADGFKLLLRAELKDAFYRVILAGNQAELAARNLETVAELRRSVEVRVTTGEAAGFELVKADVELLKAQKEVNRLRSQVELARASLNALLGNALPPSFTLIGEFDRPQGLPELSALLDTALSAHPSLSRQRREVERWQHQLSFEKQARVPDVGLGGLSMREIDKDAFAVVLSVPVPLWDRRQGQIAAATAEGRRAEAELQRLRAELTRAITQEYQNYRIAADQLAVFERGLLKQAEEALRIAQISFRQGASGLLDLLDAQRVQRITLQEYAEARYALSVARAHLERVTGRLDLVP